MGLAGNSGVTAPAFVGAKVMQTARRAIGRAVFFILATLFLLAGCGRQYRGPQEGRGEGKAPLVRVALEDNLSSGKLSFSGEYTLKSEEADYILDASLGNFVVRKVRGQLIIQSPKRQFVYTTYNPVTLYPGKDAKFMWNGIPYQGEISFVRNGSAIAVVNILPMPQYLSGVVPYEIPSNNPDYYAAVEAQAIIARTYTVYHLAHPASTDFDLYADVRHQVYMGMKKDAPLADKAVHLTAGEILKSAGNEIVETQYHSTCGDAIEKRSDYFTGDSGGFLPDQTDGSFNCEVSPFYRWVKETDTRIILNNLVSTGKLTEDRANRYKEDGFDMILKVQSRLKSGRIERLNIQVGDTVVIINEWEIRRILAAEGDSMLPSTEFFLKKLPDDSTGFYIIGAGYGHGRGMCQWGAIGMALKRKSVDDILKFYYPGLHVRKIF